MSIRFELALGCLLIWGSPPRENPEYGWWSGFKPGSWVTVKVEGDIEGQPYVLEQTQTLLETGPDRVIVSRKGTLRIGGQLLPSNKLRDEVKRVEDQALVVRQEGDERLALPTGQTQCHWLEGVDPRTNSNVKFWIAKSIPGGIAKGEMRPEGAISAAKIIALAWEAK